MHFGEEIALVVERYDRVRRGGGIIRVHQEDIMTFIEALAYQQLKLAMRVGKKYRLRDILGSDWRNLAKAVGVNGDILLERLLNMATRIPDAAASVSVSIKSEGLTHDIIDRLTGVVATHAAKCQKTLD